MKSAWFVCFTFAATLFAQEPAPAAPADKRQDPEALKLLERFDAQMYVPRAAGLADLEFTTKLASGHNLVLKWKQPDKVRADLAVPSDAAPEVARQLALVIGKFQDEARRHAPKFVDLQIGELLREKHAGDDVILVAKNQVKIVARTTASKATIKEQTLTFDDQGLVKSTKVTAPTGVESTAEPSFLPWNGKFVYQTLRTRVAANQEETLVAFEYANLDPMMLIKKVTVSSKVAGKTREQSLEFFDFKVNRGIDDKVFEDKPPEPKPR